MADVMVIKLKNFCSRKEFQLLDKISEQRRRLIYSYYKEEDAYRSYISALLVRYILCNYIECDNSQLLFGFHRYGKPYVINSTNCFFNISHSCNYVVCIVDPKECGIDIELIDRMDFDIAKDFFHKNEYLHILSYDKKEDRDNYFFFLWTVKEAYLKTLGTGLAKPLSSFWVEKYNNGKIHISDNDRSIAMPTNISSMVVDKKYYISSASFSPPHYTFIEDKELLSAIKNSSYFS